MLAAPPREWTLHADGKEFPLREGAPLAVGKDETCEVRAAHAGISRRHARIEMRNGRVFVRDLGSTNGTKWRGRMLPPDREVEIDCEGGELLLADTLPLRVRAREAVVPDREEAPLASEPETRLANAFLEALSRMSSTGDENFSRQQKLDGVFATDWGRSFSTTEVLRLRREILDAGPLTDLMADPQVSEIIANGPRSLWIEKQGALLRVEGAFLSEQSLLGFVRRMLGAVGRTLDTRHPVVDARLPDGSRLCAVTAPAVLGGTHVSIRRFSSAWCRIDRLVESGSVSERAALLLARAVADKKNILVSGGTGAGKTSLLNAVASQIGAHERILTLEDTAELQISHPHVVRLESRPANLEGEGEITIRQLLKTALRLRPDRLIVGECRGPEALDLLQALNTGHAGSMATIHANSARDALARLELLCLLGSGNSLGPAVARGYIASAVNILVHLEKRAGKRALESIHEITGVDEGVVLLKRIYP